MTSHHAEDTVHKSPGHALAQIQTQKALQDYLRVMDNFGEANEQFRQDNNGEQAICMTCIMLSGLMAHMVNIFVRTNDDSTQEVYEAIEKALKDAPTLAARVEAEMNEEHQAGTA